MRQDGIYGPESHALRWMQPLPPLSGSGMLPLSIRRQKALASSLPTGAPAFATSLPFLRAVESELEIVLFLDFRQVAAPLQFIVLDTDRLTYEELHGMLPHRPPPGWRLVVQGGSRHHQFVRVRHQETLLFGFVHERYPASDHGSDLSSPDEDNGDEEDLDDDPSIGGDSAASTRSQSKGPTGLHPRRPPITRMRPTSSIPLCIWMLAATLSVLGARLPMSSGTSARALLGLSSLTSRCSRNLTRRSPG